MKINNVLKHRALSGAVTPQAAGPVAGVVGSTVRRRIMSARLSCGLAILAAVSAGGCGYTTKRPFPGSVRSVYVDMFQSKEFRRGIEFRLTEAVRKRIDMDTDYRNAPRAKADSILTGEIKEFRQNAFADDFRTDLPREIVGQLVVSYRWKDVRNGKILAENPNLVQDCSYVRSLDETEFEGLGKAIDDLAERIVEGMESPW
jgi:hypothetical protein